MPFRVSVPLGSKGNVPNGSETKTVAPCGKAPARVDTEDKDDLYTPGTDPNETSWLDDNVIDEPSGPKMEIDVMALPGLDVALDSLKNGILVVDVKEHRPMDIDAIDAVSQRAVAQRDERIKAQ